MTNEEFAKLRLACRGAGFSNVDAIKLRAALETGSEEILKSVLDGYATKEIKAIQAEEKKARQAEEQELDELARMSQEFAGIISDPTRPDLAPELSRDELREVLRDTKRKEQTHELVGDELAALEREVAESMRSPGQPIEQILD